MLNSCLGGSPVIQPVNRNYTDQNTPLQFCKDTTPRSTGISYMKYVNGRLTGFVTFYIETAFKNRLLKER
jgi:hypothetical protein